jgi:hypothetical protein
MDVREGRADARFKISEDMGELLTGGPLPPSPPAEKATARQDQAGKASTDNRSRGCGRAIIVKASETTFQAWV